MILNGLYFFDEATSVSESEIISNTKGSILVLQVKCDGTFNFKLQGCIDTEKGDYADIAVINMSNLTKAESVNAEGIFQADISGCKKIKLTIEEIGNEPLTVYGIVKEG